MHSSAADVVSLCADGAALADVGDHDGAITCYEDAVALAPAMLALHQILANAQLLLGRTLDARSTLRHALQVAERPDAASEFALGKALVDAGAGADAVPSFRRARQAFPHDAGVAAALAAALREAQQPEDAWTEIQYALTLVPTDPVALLTAAMIRHDLSDFTGALAWCERSLASRPDASGARVTRAYLRFLLGDATGGWHDFEHRPLPTSRTAAIDWHGAPLTGKSILVMGEQGVGDQFQFLRFVRHPAFRSASRVIVSCQPDAVSLLTAAGYDAIARDEIVSTDFSVPLLSLPHRLAVSSDWLADFAAYLRPPDSVTRGPSRSLKRVGLVWAGNPAHRNDAVRSIAPRLISELLDQHPDLHVVCMQHGVSAAELPFAAHECSASGDWLTTARVLCALDLLITVDTGIAHLAGALGVRSWLLLPHVPDWRWGLTGASTPWYPTMRLFRQETRGDWPGVLARVSAALAKVVQ